MPVFNADGQTADVGFPMNPLIITEATVAKNDAGVYVSLKGANLVGQATAQWIPRAGVPVAEIKRIIGS